MEAVAIRAKQLSEDRAEPYRIDIFEAWCKSCGICVAFCPKGCLEQDEERSPFVARPDLCTGCGWCEIHCPDFAISVRFTGSRELQGAEEAD